MLIDYRYSEKNGNVYTSMSMSVLPLAIAFVTGAINNRIIANKMRKESMRVENNE